MKKEKMQLSPDFTDEKILQFLSVAQNYHELGEIATDTYLRFCVDVLKLMSRRYPAVKKDTSLPDKIVFDSVVKKKASNIIQFKRK